MIESACRGKMGKGLGHESRWNGLNKERIGGEKNREWEVERVNQTKDV